MSRFSGATQTVKEQQQHSGRRPANQGVREVAPEPNKIGASTPYDFEAKSLTAYGGLLPVATMLEKLGFQRLVEETLTVKRKTKAMPMGRAFDTTASYQPLAVNLSLLTLFAADLMLVMPAYDAYSPLPSRPSQLGAEAAGSQYLPGQFQD